MNGGMIETLIGGEPTRKKSSGPNSLLAGLEESRCGCRAGEGTSPASSDIWMSSLAHPAV